MTIDRENLKQFQKIGRDLYAANLVSSHGGNMSVRLGDRVLIKRRGVMLGHLEAGDLVETGLEQPDDNVSLASTELVVHRAIYLKTPALAVIHAHPRTAIALSLSRDEIIPVDVEGAYHLRRVPVIAAENPAGSSEIAEKVSTALVAHKIVMVRGHGCFAAGKTLEEALMWVSILEECSQILLAARLLGEASSLV